MNLRLLLAEIGWSGRHLALRIGVNERDVRRWVENPAKAPPGLVAWLELLVATLRNHPFKEKTNA